MTSQHLFDGERGASSENNYISMKKHFDYFYHNCYQPSEGKQKREHLKSFDDLLASDVTDDLCGKFGSYLASEARHKCKKDAQFLGQTSTFIYFSSFKKVLEKKFARMEAPLPTCMKEEIWNLYTTEMRRKKVKQSLKEQTPLYGSYEKATEDDVRTLVNLCLWTGDEEMAQFASMFLDCFTSCGRGSEVGDF